MLKKKALGVLQDEGIDAEIRKPKPGKDESVRLSELKKQLKRIADDPGSPRQTEAKNILNELEQRSKELGELNEELRKAKGGGTEKTAKFTGEGSVEGKGTKPTVAEASKTPAGPSKPTEAP